MYGQGNYAPQFGQSPNRPPRPPFLQQQVTHPPASTGLLHQRPPVLPNVVFQSAGQQPHAVSPGTSAYHSAPIAQSCPPTSISGTGPSYPPQPTIGHRSIPMHPYMMIQGGAQSVQYISALPPSPRVPAPPPPSQSQNVYRHPVHQPPPSMQQMTIPLSSQALPPPPPTLLQSSSLTSHATFHSVAPSTSGGSHTSSLTSQLPLPPTAPPLPPPPPSSTPHSSVPPSSSKTVKSDASVPSLCETGSSQDLTSESDQNIPTHDRNKGSGPNDVSDRGFVEAFALTGGISLMPSVTADVPTPPPRPTNEKTLRNIDILCQFISKNGPAFEDMARKKETGNPEFNFLFGGEPGSEAAIAHEYYLWMKTELSLGKTQSNLSLKDKHVENRYSVQPNNGMEASCYSLSDSDMDMEDDVIQPGEKLALNDQVSDLKQEFVKAADEMKKEQYGNSQQISEGVISQMKPVSPIKLGGDDVWRSDRTFGSITRSDDAFTLLKDYASDDSSEGDAHLEVLEPASTLTSYQCKMNISSESKATEVGISESIGAQCKQHADPALEVSASKVIHGPRSLEKKLAITVENSVRADASKKSAFHDLEEKDVLESSAVGLVSESSEAQRKHKRSAASAKVDEFGRLVREDASETDSDDSSYYRRRCRRGRNRSTSRSPTKRRRSPWRRKERRSSSQSWSPKRRRSRSRSPLRRVVDISSKRNIRGRHQMGECFNYLKGRCYRGSSCRYLHSELDKHSESRQYRSKHHASETRTSSRDHDYSEENKFTTKKASPEYDIDGEETQHDEVKGGELKTKEKQHANSDYASKGAAVDEKGRTIYVDGSVHYGLEGRAGSAIVIDQNNGTTHVGSSSCLPKTSDCKDVSDLFTSDLQNDAKPEQPESVGQKDLLALDSATTNYPYHVSQLPPPPPPPLLPVQQPPPPSLHVASTPLVPQPVQIPSDPNILSSNQHDQYHTLQNLPWSTLRPPFSPYTVNPPVNSGPASFHPDSLHLRSDPSMQPSLKTKPAYLPMHPQVGSLQEQIYSSIHGSHQAPQPPQHVHAMRPGNHLDQPIAGSVRDDRYVKSFSSGPVPSCSFPHGNSLPRPTSLLGEGSLNKLQSFSHETLPSGEPSSSAFQKPPYLQQHQSHGLYQAAGDSFRDPSHYSADILRNHPSHSSDTGSGITAHYNPYASTFDQPLSSKFSSDVFRQGKQPYGCEYENSFSLGPALFESQKVTYGVNPIIPSPHSSRAGGQALPKSGGDQYDPLFDSIEPSAESLKKQSEQEDHAADNSDIMIKLSGSKLSDAKLNRKKEELEAVATETSSETDEFGETAHDEVVVAEAGSQSNLNDGAAGGSGDFEIDQFKREGQSKKNKDSRSMKLFKVALTSFVKDMLKPSWRQGNMSKEAFKTIVQKTVEKVSGAMKGHRVPKSKAKIDQYIDRSQRKLTALVEGYVNKYAKA